MLFVLFWYCARVLERTSCSLALGRKAKISVWIVMRFLHSTKLNSKAVGAKVGKVVGIPAAGPAIAVGIHAQAGNPIVER